MDLTQIIVAFIGLLGAVVTGVLIPYIRSKTTAEQQEKIMSWVKIAVNAAEMIYGTMKGAEKKAYVLDFLKGKGFTIDEAALDAMIEAAVWELKKNS